MKFQNLKSSKTVQGTTSWKTGIILQCEESEILKKNFNAEIWNFIDIELQEIEFLHIENYCFQEIWNSKNLQFWIPKISEFQKF